MSPLVALIAVFGLVAGMAMIPFGLPGLWIMLGILLVCWMAGGLSAGLLGLLTGVVLLAEAGEWLAVQRFGSRYGGNARTFAGALLGGLVGALLGAPLPIAGPVLGAFGGTLLGGFVATWLDTRSVGTSLRAGWGALIGRAVAVGLKVFAGLFLLIVGGGALLFA